MATRIVPLLFDQGAIFSRLLRFLRGVCAFSEGEGSVLFAGSRGNA